MSWKRNGDTLIHDSGFEIKFEPFSHRYSNKPYNSKSTVVEYNDCLWRGTMTKGLRKDQTGVDEFRLLQDANAEWLRIQRGDNDPFPED